MDAPGQGVSNADVERLNEKDKAELRQFLANEVQVSQIQGQTHALTETCWRKCIAPSVRSNKLEKAEETCLANCVQRFLDVNFLTMKHLNNLRQ